MSRREMTPDDLGTLVWCAMSYDRRLPAGDVPPAAWDALSDEWRGRINQQRTARTDVLGAEVRPREEER